MNPEVPNFLPDHLARLLREWDQWDDEDRLVNAAKLAGRLLVEKTRRGKPYLLKHSSPVPPPDSTTDYLFVGQMRRDALEPYGLDLRTSMIRDAAGNWLPARIFGGVEVARRAATAAWKVECAKSMQGRQYLRCSELPTNSPQTRRRLGLTR